MARYLCRVCDSKNGWVTPSGAAQETPNTHFGSFGFAYEEWNFNPALLINGMQHGWIEGFRPGTGRRIVPNGIHQVELYVRRNSCNWLVGKIVDCEQIIGTHYEIPYPVTLIPSANAVGANVTHQGACWNVSPIINKPKMSYYPPQIPKSNIRFRPENAVLFPKPVPCNIQYTRYGSLLVDGFPPRELIWNSIP